MPQTPTITTALAERHEALWLRLAALEKTVSTLAGKRPGAPVGDAVRVAAEALISDCAPFGRGKGERLPVAAGDYAGLAVQLGQALALLDAFESRHTVWDGRQKCHAWMVRGDLLPVKRLRPVLAFAAEEHREHDRIAEQLGQQLKARWRGAFQLGFEAGRAARQGAPEPDMDEVMRTADIYPRSRRNA